MLLSSLLLVGSRVFVRFRRPQAGSPCSALAMRLATLPSITSSPTRTTESAEQFRVDLDLQRHRPAVDVRQYLREPPFLLGPISGAAATTWATERSLRPRGQRGQLLDHLVEVAAPVAAGPPARAARPWTGLTLPASSECSSAAAARRAPSDRRAGRAAGSRCPAAGRSGTARPRSRRALSPARPRSAARGGTAAPRPEQVGRTATSAAARSRRSTPSACVADLAARTAGRTRPVRADSAAAGSARCRASARSRRPARPTTAASSSPSVRSAAASADAVSGVEPLAQRALRLATGRLHQRSPLPAAARRPCSPARPGTGRRCLPRLRVVGQVLAHHPAGELDCLLPDQRAQLTDRAAGAAGPAAPRRAGGSAPPRARPAPASPLRCRWASARASSRIFAASTRASVTALS